MVVMRARGASDTDCKDMLLLDCSNSTSNCAASLTSFAPVPKYSLKAFLNRTYSCKLKALKNQLRFLKRYKEENISLKRIKGFQLLTSLFFTLNVYVCISIIDNTNFN